MKINWRMIGKVLAAVVIAFVIMTAIKIFFFTVHSTSQSEMQMDTIEVLPDN